MIENLPKYITVVFILTTLATLLFFYAALRNSKNTRVKTKSNIIFLCLVAWLIIQAAISLNGFYLDNKTIPPKFVLAVAPPLLAIIILFMTKAGKKFIDSLPLIHLTWLHIVRIPVELVLYLLFLNRAVPELMTFAGRNFDILAGITAPFVAYFGLQQKNFSKKFILVWNFIGLTLLLNIVINAILSAPFAFQQFAFDQPNIAILYFPFNWLPAFIVPAVLFSHLVAIRRLTGRNR